MPEPSVEDKFRAADVSGYPMLPGLTEREQVLWVLAVGKERAGHVWVAAGEVWVVLRDVYGVPLSRQKVQAILAAERVASATSRKGGLRRYQIMQPGIDELLAKRPDVLLIEPEKALTGLRSAQALMQSLTGVVRFCDPYVESASLDLLADATAASEIRLLTVNISKPQVLARDLAAFRKEHAMTIEVRQAAPGSLHDRYAIDSRRMLMFGTSLNGIGKKQSLIVELGEDVRATVLPAFDRVWQSAKVV